MSAARATAGGAGTEALLASMDPSERAVAFEDLTRLKRRVGALAGRDADPVDLLTCMALELSAENRRLRRMNMGAIARDALLEG